MAEVVAHPETGLPAVVETSYRTLELEQERTKLNDLQSQLDQVTAQHAEVLSQKTALESAVEDQKSLLERAEAVAPKPESDGASAGVDGVEALADAGQPDGSVTVPVAVEDEY